MCLFTFAVGIASDGTLVLACIWQYYCKHMTHHIPEYILVVYHTNLVKLPWKHFFPDLSVLDQMAKVSCLKWLSCEYLPIDCLILVSLNLELKL